MSDTADAKQAPCYSITLRRPDGTGGTCTAPTLAEAVDMAGPMFGLIDDKLEIENIALAVHMLLKKRGRA